MRSKPDAAVKHDVIVLGRFPPPLDGQTMATRRLADLLAEPFAVRRLNTSVAEEAFVAVEVRFRWARLWHYLGLLPRLWRGLAGAPQASVLWASVSPAPLGHWRDLLATLPAFRPGQRVFAVLHRGGFEDLFRHPLTALTARYLVRRLDGFVFLNEPFAARCAPWIPTEKRFVLPNTIDEAVICTEEEVAAKRAARRGRTRLRLLFLSSLIALKGYRDVLEAVRLLRARGVAVEARFAGRWGSPADRDYFEQFVRQHDLGETVTACGALTERAEVKALHRWADVFLLPSYHPTEAQPLALIEALAAGTPAVVTRHGGLPAMVQHGREAFLVPSRQPAALAEAVVALGDREAWQAFSEQARRRFEAHYSPMAVQRQWVALLREQPEGSLVF